MSQKEKPSISSSGHFASSPCYAAEFADESDAQQQQDLANWRKAERKWQLAARKALSPEQRDALAIAVAKNLDTLLREHFPTLQGKSIGGYWPIQSELNLVFWFCDLHERGVRIALPITAQQDAPLIFRAWTPETIMDRDCWNIPIPPEVNEQLQPDILLAPCVAWDENRFRLGYGGGYFDRTLAALSPKPFVIGVGLESAKVSTIFPQRYDIAMDAVVTETGVHSL